MKFNNMLPWIYTHMEPQPEVDDGVPVMGVLIKD